MIIIKQRKGEKRVGGGKGKRKIEVLSTATSTQSPNHKTKKKNI